MKKLFVLIGVFFLCGAVHCIAQNADLKYYSAIQDGDLTHRYEGYASAEFICDESETDADLMDEVEKLIPKDIRRVTKLTKNTVWLCKKALNEWEYKQGEYYMVLCTDSPYDDKGIFLLIKVIGKDDFEWWGVMITEDNAESFLDALSDLETLFE